MDHRSVPLFSGQSEEDNESRMYVKDYAVLDSFVNTYQDYIGAKKREQKSSWLNTDQMVCCDVEEYSVCTPLCEYEKGRGFCKSATPLSRSCSVMMLLL